MCGMVKVTLLKVSFTKVNFVGQGHKVEMIKFLFKSWVSKVKVVHGNTSG